MSELIIDESCIKIGRGPSTYNHEGNNRFREMVGKYLSEYKISPKPKKTLLVNRVHREICELGMQFIQKKDGVWTKVDNEDEVRRKVAHRFRDAIEAEKRKTNPEAARLSKNVVEVINPDAVASSFAIMINDSGSAYQDSKPSASVSSNRVVERLYNQPAERKINDDEEKDNMLDHESTVEDECLASVVDGANQSRIYLSAADIYREYAPGSFTEKSQFVGETFTNNAAEEPLITDQPLFQQQSSSEMAYARHERPDLASIFDEVTLLMSQL